MAHTKIGLCLLLPFLAAAFLPEEAPPAVHSPVPVPEHLGGAFTGGFGEQTCHSCHFDYPLNPEEGSVDLEGLPEFYTPEKTYSLTVVLSAPQLARGGFQLSVRHPDSTQAGMFEWSGKRVQLTSGQKPVLYLQHTREGTETDRETMRWGFEWIAPDSARPVVFHLAGNASNNDESAFGDLIHTAEVHLEPEKQ